MKATKKFKIGEYALGGIIKVQITGKVIQINALDWNTEKSISSGTILSNDYNSGHYILNYLNELTSYYYADKIMQWIETKIKLEYGM